MSDPFIDLCLGIQAVRRTVEREIAGLGGATGVAAVPYPHQLANVQRILTDSRIRHLIADEVGLGKTVQTLMVLNALRLQNPRHRALILVPGESSAPMAARMSDAWPFYAAQLCALRGRDRRACASCLL